MTQASIITHVHETFDILRHFAAQVTFNLMICINRFANLQHFLVGQVVNPALTLNADFFTNFGGFRRADAVNIT